MSMDKKNYQQIVKQKTPPSKSLTNCLKAFVIGGLICVVGQLISNGLKAASLSEDAVKGLTSASMIFLGSFFTAVGVYDKLAKHGGAGTLVPITGFANSIVSPAMEFKSEGLVLGVGAKMFVIAGPVLVYGITASVLYGVIYYFIKVLGG